MLFVSGVSVFKGRGFQYLQSHRLFLSTIYLCQNWRSSLPHTRKLHFFSSLLILFALSALDQLPTCITVQTTFDKPNCVPVRAGICVYRKWLCVHVCGFMSILISAFLCVCLNVFVYERDFFIFDFLSVCVISIASAEQWSVIETCLRVAHLNPLSCLEEHKTVAMASRASKTFEFL